ncbi:hypothetical protein SLOPH_2409 [Spraguea lophii 42_110]|uniref:Tetratricopeptide repeat protein n=1 Tax=Spraguea lophii (strain 42_110) TaxID=1358809 RepID=S7W623_SPRLO|nr:hypothetical protein SLOPH_2409 [Spraguea lophii 42_110]
MSKNINIIKLIKDKQMMAIALSKEYNFFERLYKTTDYYKAAIIYSEIAEHYLSLENNEEAEKNYIKSGELFLKVDELGEALYAFKKGAEILCNVELYQRASECAWAVGNNSIGASIEMKIAKITNNEENYRKAIKYYKRDKMNISAKNVMEKLVWLLVEKEKYIEAGHMFLEINKGVKEFQTNLNIICSYFCFFLANEEELMNNVKFIADGEELVLIENLEEEKEDAFEKYLEVRAVKNEVRILLQKVKDRIKCPEYDLL